MGKHACRCLSCVIKAKRIRLGTIELSLKRERNIDRAETRGEREREISFSTSISRRKKFVVAVDQHVPVGVVKERDSRCIRMST